MDNNEHQQTINKIHLHILKVKKQMNNPHTMNSSNANNTNSDKEQGDNINKNSSELKENCKMENNMTSNSTTNHQNNIVSNTVNSPNVTDLKNDIINNDNCIKSNTNISQNDEIQNETDLDIKSSVLSDQKCFSVNDGEENKGPEFDGKILYRYFETSDYFNKIYKMDAYLFIFTGISDDILFETHKLNELSSKESDENSEKNYTPNFSFQKEENNNATIFNNNDDDYVSAESNNVSLQKTDIENVKSTNLNEHNIKDCNINETGSSDQNESLNHCDYIIDDNYKVQNNNMDDENYSRMFKKRNTSDMLLNCMDKKQKIDITVLESSNLKLASQLDTEVAEVDNNENEKKNTHKEDENKISENSDQEVDVKSADSIQENNAIYDILKNTEEKDVPTSNPIKASNNDDVQNNIIEQDSINVTPNDASISNIESSTKCIANTMLSFYDSINWEAEQKATDAEHDNNKYSIHSEEDQISGNFSELENPWNLNTQSSFHTNTINTSLNKNVIVISNSDDENKNNMEEVNNEKVKFDQINKASNNINPSSDKKIISHSEQCSNNNSKGANFNNSTELNASSECKMKTKNMIINKEAVQNNHILSKTNKNGSTELYKNKVNYLKDVDMMINNYDTDITMKDVSKNNINIDNEISLKNWSKDTINNNERSESDETDCTHEVDQFHNIINTNLNINNGDKINVNPDNCMYINNPNLLNSVENNNIININKIDNQKYIDVNDSNFDTIDAATNFDNLSGSESRRGSDNISEREEIDNEKKCFTNVDQENDKYMQWFDTIYTVCVKLDELCCKLNSSFPHSMDIWNNSGKVNMYQLKSVFNINENWNNIYNQDYKKNKNDILLDVNIQKSYNNQTCRNYNKNGILTSNISNEINNNECQYTLKDGTIIDNKNNLLSNHNNINNCVNYDVDKNNYSKVEINNYVNSYNTDNFNNNLVHLDNGLICKNRSNKNVNENNNVNMNPPKNNGIINNNVKMAQIYGSGNGNGNENTIKNVMYYQNKQYNVGPNLENNKIPINSNNGNMNSILNLTSNNMCNINNMGSNLVDNMYSIYGNITNPVNNKNNINIHRYNNDMTNYMNINNVHNLYSNTNGVASVNPEMDGKKMKNSKKNSNNVINKNTEKNNNTKKRNSVNRSNNRIIKDESEFEYLLDLPDKDGPNLDNPEDLKCDIAGVYWDKRSWIASWYDNGKRYYKSFSAKTHGFYKSKFWAIKVRLSKVKGQTIFGKHNRKPKNNNPNNETINSIPYNTNIAVGNDCVAIDNV
ncbi:AP2 domain transcription factor AP2-O, putative [Plasmodium chabaudi chabaudi]|uniref:AP2 domain transcription factor AP2-O, putative n=1 Tax=Plasmodium chabaudi chabaudi TaxID=31271 RepID=A0A4V0K4S2_PLACU|nr:AP2 domain transcription factor AP2-O, putative [Plasmodium chabaudi chabaudi]VTZ67941.1 AP2 domain transcription factor AP2-O, putative [Plasmodium chabaudi chabaudi]